MFRKSDNNEELVNISHLKNLMILALADGHIAEIEEHLLISIAHRLSLDENDIDKIKSELDQIEFVLPPNYDQRIEQFSDLLRLMAIDGHIDPGEEQVCRAFAKKYELMENVVEDMIAKFR